MIPEWREYLKRCKEKAKVEWRTEPAERWDYQTLEAATFAMLYLPHYCRLPFSRLHAESMMRYDALPTGKIESRKGQRYAVAAPRGAAKSTIVSLLFPLMDLCLQRERYIVIISATLSQAGNRLFSLASEIKGNEKIQRTFFAESPVKKKWSRYRIEWNGVRIDAYGAGSEIRGISYNGYRPTKIILDDVEHCRNANRAWARQKLWEWYAEVIENLGDTTTHIDAVGTILHRDSLLSRLFEQPRYTGKIYKSVDQWSQKTGLWQEWAKLYTDRQDTDRIQTADTYYYLNRRAMMRDTKVLWPEKENYKQLMETLINTGRYAFFKEKQNSPFAKEGRVFDTRWWARFKPVAGEMFSVAINRKSDDGEAEGLFVPVDLENAKGWNSGRHISSAADTNGGILLGRIQDCAIFGFLDPAMGNGRQKGTGDFAAIVTVARDKAGNAFVLDVWMERARPERQIERAFELHNQFRYTAFGFESNGFQEILSRHFADEQRRRCAVGISEKLPLRSIDNKLNKEARIHATEFRISAGSVVFRYDLPEEFFVQADEFPHGNHDDGIDALASCLELSDLCFVRQPDSAVRNISRRSRQNTF